MKRLDKPTSQAKIPPISGKLHLSLARPIRDHPGLQIVAREEDAEFVECLECGDIFESSEFKDMMIEDTRLKNESYKE
jgi:hypothetical protein